MSAPQCIGLAGTNGSGKDTVGKILAQYHHYFFISVSDLLRAEARARGLAPSRENTRAISAEWRQKYGLGVLVDRGMEAYKQVSDQYAGVVMANFRNPGEADRVHEFGGVMVWVDADPHVRYSRVQANSAARGADRAVDDKKSFEAFMADEAAEMHRQAGADETTLHMAAVKNRCDIFIDNSSDSLDDFRNEIESKLGL